MLASARRYSLCHMVSPTAKPATHECRFPVCLVLSNPPDRIEAAVPNVLLQETNAAWVFFAPTPTIFRIVPLASPF